MELCVLSQLLGRWRRRRDCRQLRHCRSDSLSPCPSVVRRLRIASWTTPSSRPCRRPRCPAPDRPGRAVRPASSPRQRRRSRSSRRRSGRYPVARRRLAAAAAAAAIGRGCDASRRCQRRRRTRTAWRRWARSLSRPPQPLSNDHLSGCERVKVIGRSSTVSSFWRFGRSRSSNVFDALLRQMQGRRRVLLAGVQCMWSGGRNSPVESRRRAPVRGLGTKSPKSWQCFVNQRFILDFCERFKALTIHSVTCTESYGVTPTSNFFSSDLWKSHKSILGGWGTSGPPGHLCPWTDVTRSVVCVSVSVCVLITLMHTVQTRLNRSRCRLKSWLMWAQRTMF